MENRNAHGLADVVLCLRTKNAGMNLGKKIKKKQRKIEFASENEEVKL